MFSIYMYVCICEKKNNEMKLECYKKLHERSDTCICYKTGNVYVF